jgi:hypothetical protein
VKINVNVNVSGTIIHKFEVAAGTSPLATLDDLEETESRIMSKVREHIDALKSSLDAADARILEDFDNLKKVVADEVPTAEELADLAALKVRIDGEDPDPDFPPTTPPPDQGTNPPDQPAPPVDQNPPDQGGGNVTTI